MRKEAAVVLLLALLLAAACLTLLNQTVAASSDVWVTKASLNVARASLGAAVVNGEIYAIGGVIDPPSYGVCTGVNEKFDPASNQWTFRAELPTPRASFAVAAVEGKIYCIGGTTGFKDGQVVACGFNEVYDPTTDAWTTRTEMPTPRVGVTAAVVDDKIFVVGGGSNVTEVYDPATDTWTTVAAMPFKPELRLIWSCTSAVLDCKIHVFGGFPYSVSHQVYDPDADCWSVEAPIVQGYLLASATPVSPRSILVFGVDDTWWDTKPPNFTSTIYDDKAGCWRLSSLMPTPRVNAALAAVDDAVYVIGGSIVMIENNAHPTSIVEQYTPQKDQPVDVQPPKITVLSPQNKTYFTAQVAIDFMLNKPAVNLQFGVDGQTLVSADGNSSYTFQPGKHCLTVYATDHQGNVGVSETVHFTIAEPESSPYFLMPVLVGAGVLVFLVGVVLAWYFRRKNRLAA